MSRIPGSVPLAIGPALALATAVPLAAQALRGGDLLVPDYNANAVFRIDASGAVSTFLSAPLLAGPAGVAFTHERDLVVADLNSGTLVHIDATSGTPTTVASGLGVPLHVVEDQGGDFIVTSGMRGALLRVTLAGQVTTLATGLPLQHPGKLAVDRNGDLLVTDDRANSVFRVTAGGTVTTIHAGPPLQVPSAIALFPNGDYAVGDISGRCVFRIDRQTRAVTVFCPSSALGGSPSGIAADFGGGFVASVPVGPGTSRLVAIDALGAVSPIVGAPPLVGAQDVAKAPYVAGAVQLATGAGSRYAFDVDVPSAPGGFYSLLLSASVYPGWPIPGTAQAIALNPDPLLYATIGQNSPPALVGWSAFLDASGRGTATTDLRMLPPGVLNGLVLYQQGVTLGSGAQLGPVLNLRRLGFR
jgi:hypothetical protein